MKTKKAFSFVEIIIVISIITLLVIVGMSYQGAQNQKTKNTRAIGNLGTLNNSLANYLEEKNKLPEPKGNKNYFSSGSEYKHDETGSFGVHGFVTKNLLPNKYLNYLPLDPRTNQYYAYGKTIDEKFYEIAGVLNIEGEYVSKVQGNFPGDNGIYSLIREYNGPDFVSDKSKISFPYNPQERILIGKINSFTGDVKINGNNTGVKEHTLVEGDTITVPAGETATIFFSDGSQSVLGDNSLESKIVLANLEFKENDNLLTRIQLALDSGTLWTKVTNLNKDGSDFEVYTQDTSAAVRGTIFGVKRISGETIVAVEEGQIEVKKIPTVISTEEGNNETEIRNLIDIIKAIKKNNIKENLQPIGTITDSIIKSTDSKSNSYNTTTNTIENVNKIEIPENKFITGMNSVNPIICKIGEKKNGDDVNGKVNNGVCQKQITIDTSLDTFSYIDDNYVKIFLRSSSGIFYLRVKNSGVGGVYNEIEVDNNDIIYITKSNKKYCIKNNTKCNDNKKYCKEYKCITID